MKNRKRVIGILIALILIILVCILFFVLHSVKNAGTSSNGEATESSVQSSETSEASDSYLHIEYNGKHYTYNSRIITVMYSGIDSDEDLITYNRYSIAPRADTIELVIFDDYNKKISILAISRDTITSVARYTMNGNYRDNYDTHLGYAYTYGDGGQVSCNNLIASVSTLLKNVPIHEYVITNNSSVGKLNDMVGGVTVTCPNDDLIEMYPDFKTGAVVTLDAETADTFARWRDITIPFTNNGRMERQREFSMAFFEKFISMAESDSSGTWAKIEDFSANYQTSITENQYLDLVDRLETESFSEDQYYMLEGESVYDEEHDLDEFYVDEDNLMETVLKLFYLEDEE